MDDVTQMWKQHFDALYNKPVDSRFRSVFEDKMANTLLDSGGVAFTVTDVMNAVHKQKLGKCPGPDDIHMEAFCYGGK